MLLNPPHKSRHSNAQENNQKTVFINLAAQRTKQVAACGLAHGPFVDLVIQTLNGSTVKVEFVDMMIKSGPKCPTFGPFKWKPQRTKKLQNKVMWMCYKPISTFRASKIIISQSKSVHPWYK